jgi:hypothetical protein
VNRISSGFMTATEWKTLLLEPWWVWRPNVSGWGDVLYHWFNLLEAAAWLVCACIVILRSQPDSRVTDSKLAAALLLFAASDVAEAWALSIPLAAVKLVILLSLIRLRKKRNLVRA